MPCILPVASASPTRVAPTCRVPFPRFAIGIAAACQIKGCLGGAISPGLPLVVFIIALFSWTYIARIDRR